MSYFERRKKIDAAKAANPAAFDAAVALEQAAQQAKREFEELGCLWPTDSAEQVTAHQSSEQSAINARAVADKAWSDLGLAE
jgi:hypothetical protein